MLFRAKCVTMSPLLGLNLSISWKHLKKLPWAVNGSGYGGAAYSSIGSVLIRQVPLERDINIAVNGCFGFATSTQKGPFTAMLISGSRGTYLIAFLCAVDLVTFTLVKANNDHFGLPGLGRSSLMAQCRNEQMPSLKKVVHRPPSRAITR